MASEKAHAFYHPDPTPLERARRAACAASLKDAFRDGFCIWVLCTWCGHTRLTAPGLLAALGKDPPNALDELEQCLTCEGCKRLGGEANPDRPHDGLSATHERQRERLTVTMKKKLPMKGDPLPDWLRQRPNCPCTNPTNHNINGHWFCELCFQAGQETWDLLNTPLSRREADRGRGPTCEYYLEYCLG